MHKLFWALLILAWATWNWATILQDSQKVPAPDGKLSRQEVLEGRVLGLEIGQFQMMATTCLPDPKRPIQEQLDQINKEIQARQIALEKVAVDIMKSRNLDPAKFYVNWMMGQVEPRPTKP